MMGRGRLDLRPPSTCVVLPPISLATASRAVPLSHNPDVRPLRHSRRSVGDYRLRRGDQDGEPGATFRRSVDLDAPAVFTDDLLDQGQPKSGALRLGGKERLEDARCPTGLGQEFPGRRLVQKVELQVIVSSSDKKHRVLIDSSA